MIKSAVFRNRIAVDFISWWRDGCKTDDASRLSRRRILSPAHMSRYGPLARYVKLRVAHAPGMPGTFSPSQWISDPDMHHGTCATHVPWCMPGSLTSGFLWSRCRRKRSRHSRRMRNSRFYVSGKRPMHELYSGFIIIWLHFSQTLIPNILMRGRAMG